MATFKKFFGAASLGMILLVANASASTITQTLTVYGNIPSFSAPGTSTTSAAKFDQSAIDAAIALACPSGHTCSASTLESIDFSLTANLSSTVGVANTSGSTAYIGAIPGQLGTSGSATSGVAVASVATLSLDDPIFAGVVAAIPTFSIATNTAMGPGCSGSPGRAGFSNCLSIASGGQNFSGSGTDTKTASYTSSDIATYSGITAAYVGTGVVTFTLNLNGVTQNGSLPSGVTIPTNTASVNSLTNGLVINYVYSYTDTDLNAAPEPASLLLMGSALLGIGLFRKRKSI